MKNKKIILIILCITALFMAIGYAVFATNLRINGSVGISGKWLVHFTSIKTETVTGGASNNTAPTASGTVATMDANLDLPGDSITYTLTLANDGNVNAIIDNIDAKAEGSNAIVFSIDGIKKGDKLAIGDSKTITIKIEYDENFTSQPEETTKLLTVNINCVQDVGQTITGEDVVVEGPVLLSSQILRDNTAQPDTNIDFSQISSDTNGKGLYYTSTNTEDNKKTYYFRGNVTNNYVSFRKTMTCTYNGYKVTYLGSDGNYSVPNEEQCNETNVCYYNATYPLIISGVTTESECSERGGTYTEKKASWGLNIELWRIIRINEDGSVRLIKQDLIGYSAFNTSYNDNAYVGYMYGTPGSSTYAETHKNTNSSTIKTVLDTWHQNNLTGYSSLIADAGFCGDRSLATSTGIGTTETYYGANNRLYTNKTPQFKCPQENDLYTTKTSIKGNKALDYPIGLITADEVAYAGGVYDLENKDFYLKSSSDRTMTPFLFHSFAGMSVVYGGGSISQDPSYASYGVRPVINLKSNVNITNK